MLMPMGADYLDHDLPHLSDIGKYPPELWARFSV